MKTRNTETNSADNQKKGRRSRPRLLDPHYYVVAALMLERSHARTAGRRGLSLSQLCERVSKKCGVYVDKSTLSRYLAQHSTLKLL